MSDPHPSSSEGESRKIIVPSEIKAVMKAWINKKGELVERIKLRKEMTKKLDEDILKIKEDVAKLGSQICEYMADSELEEIKFKDGGGIKVHRNKKNKITLGVVEKVFQSTNMNESVKKVLLGSIDKASAITQKAIRQIGKKRS